MKAAPISQGRHKDYGNISGFEIDICFKCTRLMRYSHLHQVLVATVVGRRHARLLYVQRMESPQDDGVHAPS